MSRLPSVTQILQKLVSSGYPSDIMTSSVETQDSPDKVYTTVVIYSSSQPSTTYVVMAVIDKKTK